jgi:hypothetical protein
MRYLQTLIGACCIVFSSWAAAEEAIKVFEAGERVKAAEINANFQVLLDEITQARAEIADAVSFEGIEDVYNGLDDSSDGDAATAQFNARSGLKSLPGSTLKPTASSVVACSEEDTSCVIVGNKASVTCTAGETGKLQSVLASPLANAAFLLVEIDGDCVEDDLLVTRGAAFFSNRATAAKASISAVSDTAATCVNNYCYFGNIDINGRITAARGSSVILQENITFTDITPNVSPTVYAGEGAFLFFGTNIDVQGNLYAEGGASLAVYGPNNTIEKSMYLKGADLVAQIGGLTVPRFTADVGANVQMKYGTFDIDYINVTGGSSMDVYMPAGVPGQLTTKSIWVTQGSEFRAQLLNDSGLDMTAIADGTWPQPGFLYVWDSSTSYLSFTSGVQFRGMHLDGGGLLRLAPQGENSISVGSLELQPGSQIKSNNAGSPNIVVTDSLTAKANTVIQYGAVDATGAVLDIADGCASNGLHGDLCP